jgi:hypothetical protein
MAERQLESVSQPVEGAPDIQLYFSTLNLPEYLIATAGVTAHRRVTIQANHRIFKKPTKGVIYAKNNRGKPYDGN